MECVVCGREGGNDCKGVITLQSTSSGMVCPKCINGLVEDALMRTSNKKSDKWTR
jgi:hypothetical protein